MRWAGHRFFRDTAGVVHQTREEMGTISTMECELNGNFGLAEHELEAAQEPVTCVQCLAQASRT